MAMMYFHSYYSFGPTMEKLTDEEAGRLYKALYRFAIRGERTELEGKTEGILFDLMAGQIERDREKYDEKCRRLSENAQKRWGKAEKDEGCNCRQGEEKQKGKKERKKEEKDKEKEEDKKEEEEQKEEDDERRSDVPPSAVPQAPRNAREALRILLAEQAADRPPALTEP